MPETLEKRCGKPRKIAQSLRPGTIKRAAEAALFYIHRFLVDDGINVIRRIKHRTVDLRRAAQPYFRIFNPIRLASCCQILKSFAHKLSRFFPECIRTRRINCERTYPGAEHTDNCVVRQD